MSEQTVSFKIGLTPKGAYDSTTEYAINDVVYSYNLSGTTNGVYVAKAASVGKSLTNTDYWTLMVDLTNVKDAVNAAQSIIKSWEGTTGYEAQIQGSISDAKTATSSANEAATNATTEAAKVTAEIAKADAAIEDMTSVKDAAVNATTSANNATTNANAAAATANKATKEMEDQAASDHAQYVADNTQYQADHAQYGKDHTQAVSDHSNYTADRATFATDEAARQATFEASEASRTTTFEASEANRDSIFASKEETRDEANAAALAAAESIAKLNTEVGDLRDLSTEAHGSLVDAINEVYGYAYEEDGHVYGVRHYFNQSSTSLTRFQTSTQHDLHMLLPVQSLMRRCVVNDNGEVVYYLNHEDSTKKESGEDAVLDGTDGQVMVEIPQHYRRHQVVENADDPSLSYYETAISLLPFSGAFKVHKCYISAYEASLDRTNSKLASVVNTTSQYRGGNNNADWDGTYRDLCGKPATVISLTNFRKYARNRGELWNCQEWDIYNTLYWLYVVEYANLNCQLTFNANRDGDGHHQGGLGMGVSGINSTKWSELYSYYPFVPCGVTNSLGNATGVVEYNVPDDAEGVLYTPQVPSYRGVENPFGHIWKWMDGFLAVGNGTTQEYYICHDRTKFASTINDAYEDKGQSVGANGYVKEIVRNDEGDILATNAQGGSSTYFADYHYEAFANGTTYGVYSGGNAYYGASDGFVYLNSINAPSYSFASVGSRLCWSDKSTIYDSED